MHEIDFTKIEKYADNDGLNTKISSNDKHEILHALILSNINNQETIINSNAYTAASLIKSEHNWLKRKDYKKYTPAKNGTKKLSYGQVCFIEFGKAYHSEMAYCHCGLYVGKYNGKCFVVPITSVLKNYSDCYHPIDNKTGDKAFRRAKEDEGFLKKCILQMNDAKFISVGRIIAGYEIIKPEALAQIKDQLFSVILPDVYRSENKIKQEYSLLLGELKTLQEENRKLHQRIQDINSYTIKEFGMFFKE